MDTALAYRPEIDGLRALAVTIVVLFHAGLGFAGGYVGVDVFFVISGFLITSLILKDVYAGQFSIVAFYERRCRRIMPASAIVTLAVLAAAAYVMLPLDFEWVGQSAVAHALCLANVFFYRQTTQYFGGEAGSFPLLHMWSLAVEEQFYLIFPLLLVACARLFRRRLRVAISLLTAALAAMSFGAALFLVSTGPMAAFFLLPARAWELLLGTLLALAPRQDWPRAAREALGWMGLAAVLLPSIFYSAKTPFPGVAALPPCVGAAMLIWSITARPSAQPANAFRQASLGRWLSLRPVVFVGSISYSLYLWHWPALVMAKYWNVVPLSWPMRVAVLALTVFLATMSWRWIESPFRRKRVAAARWSIFATTAAAVVAVGVLGWLIQSRNGLPKRFAATVRAFDAARREMVIPPTLHNTNPQQDHLPAFGSTGPNPATDASVDVLLWGDSHAAAALPAFDAACRAHGLVGRAAIRSSTAPLLDYVVSPTLGMGLRAPQYSQAVLQFVARHHVRTVFMVAFWTRDIENDPDKLAVALRHTIGALSELGVQVYVFGQVPVYTQNVPAALSIEARRGHIIKGWRTTAAQHEAAQAVMAKLAGELSTGDCHFVDLAAPFRKPGTPEFLVSINDRSLYHDDNHLSRWGAKRVLGPVLTKLLAPRTPSPATQPGTP